MGKTWLALQSALPLRAAFPDDIWFVDLVGTAGITSVADTSAATLGVRDRQGQEGVDTLIAAPRPRLSAYHRADAQPTQPHAIPYTAPHTMSRTPHRALIGHNNPSSARQHEAHYAWQIATPVHHRDRSPRATVPYVVSLPRAVLIMLGLVVWRLHYP